jgi:DNA-binding XRE family transcriptional regulator
MPKKKTERVRLERLSRNPRPSRQSTTVGGKPVFELRRPLQEMRESVGISQSRLAESVGIPTSAIANVENGRYALSARVGARIYTALARFAPPKSPQYREAKQEAERLFAFQRELDRKTLIAAQGQIEALKKKCEEVKSREADLDAEEAQLREV